MPYSPNIAQNTLRQRMIQQRLALTSCYKNIQTPKLLTKLQQLCAPHSHIAFFYPHHNEPDISPLWTSMLTHKPQLFLPHINQDNLLEFRQFHSTTPLIKGRFNIPTPPPHNSPALANIDLYLVPLVACDKDGYRIGMGKGYYDAYFAAQATVAATKPLVVGVAWDFQYYDAQLPINPWDHKLDALVTPNLHHYWQKKSTP